MNMNMTLPDPARAQAYFDNKLSFTTGPVELDRLLKSHENVNVIDVREEEDYRKGHVPSAVNLPAPRWDSLEGLSKDRINVVYCYSQQCHLAARAARQFAGNGFPVMELEGGFEAWRDYDMDVEKAHANRLFSAKK